MGLETMRQQLMKRVADNYAQYRAGLLLKERQELIDGADRIAKTAEVIQYLSEWKCSEQELSYLLKFQNPLEVVTDRWENCTFDLDALGALVTDMADREVELTDYPLMPESLLEDGLYLINGAIYLHIQTDWANQVDYTLYDKETMRKADHWTMNPDKFLSSSPEHNVADVRFAVFAEHGVNVVSVSSVSPNMLQKLKDTQLDPHLDEYPWPDYSCTMTDIARRGYVDGGLLPVKEDTARNLANHGFAIYEVDAHGKVRGPMWQDTFSQPNTGSILAVSRVGWQNSRMFQKMVADRMVYQTEREQAFLRCSQDCFAIYQLNRQAPELRYVRYESLEYLQTQGQRPQKGSYELVYTAFLPEGAGPDDLWCKFNTDYPPDYQHPSLSVSDVIAVKKDGTLTCYYLDQHSYAVLDDFFDQGARQADLPAPDHKPSIKGQLTAPKAEPAEKPAVQRHQKEEAR